MSRIHDIVNKKFNNRITSAIRNVIYGITEEINTYITSISEEHIPEWFSNAIHLDIMEIASVIVEESSTIQSGSNILVTIPLDRVSSIVTSITESISSNQSLVDNVDDIIGTIQVDSSIIHSIIVNNLQKAII